MTPTDETGETHNAFGHSIPNLAQCLNGALGALLGDQLCGLLRVRAGAAPADAGPLARALFATIDRQQDQGPAAAACSDLLAREQRLDGLRGDLPARSRRMALQVRAHLQTPAVLDFGCGDGQVGAALSVDGCEVGLCDLVDLRHPDARGLPWRQVRSGSEARLFDTPWDTALVLNVLHHSFSPQEALRQLAAQGPRRVVTIESVFQVTPDSIPAPQREQVLGDNPEYGPRLFYSAVVTTAPLPADEPLTRNPCPHPSCVLMYQKEGTTPCLASCPARCISGELSGRKIVRSSYDQLGCMPLALISHTERFTRVLELVLDEEDKMKRKMILYGTEFQRCLYDLYWAGIEGRGTCWICQDVCPVGKEHIDLR